MKETIQGVYTALITPFTETGVDFEAYGKLIEFQIESGVDGLLILGTTGEPPTMSVLEKMDVIDFAIKKINGRVKAMVGVGANCTASAVESAKYAEKVGADSLLAVTPYYNKCTQKGLLEYYAEICNNTSLPVVAYNVPGRTGVNILPETAKKIAELKNMIAIKEACGNMEQISLTAKLTRGNMVVMSGDDGLTLPIMAVGGKGIISVLSNVMPKEMVELVKLAQSGQTEKAIELNDKLLTIMKLMFIEVNPIPVKTAASLMGLCSDKFRSPLTNMEEGNLEKLKAEMKNLGLIS